MVAEDSPPGALNAGTHLVSGSCKVSSFTSAAALCHDILLSSLAVTAEQVEAAGGTAEAIDESGLKGKDLGLAGAFPLPTDKLELARHVNEFLAERPAY